jgi:hypothetical protein
MKTSSIVALVAVAIVGATAAWAQTAPEAPKGPPGKPGEHARSFDPARAKNMCADRYAHSVGRLAYLEAKLDLTTAQKPLFQKWEQTVLGSAQKGRDDCVAKVAAFKPGARPTVLDRESRMETMLTAKLDAMKAQRPAMEALYASLTPDQQAQLNRPMHGGMSGHHGPHGMDGDHRPARL